jgi:catechol 2,3-dioxygenase-like lactoylglutathione lyase family enzyme
MLDRVDRMLIAVRDRTAAAATFSAVLGAEKTGDDSLALYNASRTTMRAGDSEFDLLEPSGDGPVAELLDSRGEGIFGAGFSTPDLDDLTRSLEGNGVRFGREGDSLFIEPDQTHGMRTAIRQSEPREPAGLISFVYEVTNVVDDHKATASFYTRIFGLDQSRFSPIDSEMWGYVGTLTLFNPPERLDRIEITQTTDAARSMGRFYERRGQSVYMCFVETPDAGAIKDRLDARKGRYQQLANDPAAGLYIHPSALHGILMGVSATNVAWRWSGHPELAPKSAAGSS